MLGIEHGVAFEERDFPFDFLALLAGLGSNDPVGIDDKLTLLAFADTAA